MYSIGAHHTEGRAFAQNSEPDPAKSHHNGAQKEKKTDISVHTRYSGVRPGLFQDCNNEYLSIG